MKRSTVEAAAGVAARLEFGVVAVVVVLVEVHLVSDGTGRLARHWRPAGRQAPVAGTGPVGLQSGSGANSTEGDGDDGWRAPPDDDGRVPDDDGGGGVEQSHLVSCGFACAMLAPRPCCSPDYRWCIGRVFCGRGS